MEKRQPARHVPGSAPGNPGGTATGFAIALFLNHASCASRLPHPPIWAKHLLAWGMDCLLLALVLSGIRRLASREWISVGCRRTPLVMPLYLAAGALSVYPFLLPEYLAHPVNVFGAGPGTIRFALSSVIGPTGFLWAAFTWTLGALFARMRPVSLRLRRPALALLAVVALTLPASELGVPFLVPYPHPLAFSLLGSLRETLFPGDRVVPSPERADPRKARGRAPAFPSIATAGRYDHILLLVMESATVAFFQENYLEREDGFAASVRGRSVWFSNHHTTNLDSYPSLLAMLTGRQVPYRAYENPDYFAGLDGAPSLVRNFAARGFHTGFFCTAMNQPFIPCRGQWARITEGKDLGGDFRRIELNPVEDAWEDRAALPAILKTMRGHPRTFLTLEMVMGHTPRWEDLTGMGTGPYYNLFFRELFAGVEEAGLARRTLFIVVGDHGERQDACLPANYRVPLLFIGDALPGPKEDDAFRSHLDLPALLFAFQDGAASPPPRDGQLVIGHTGRWTYGWIGSDGSCVFLDALRGTVLHREGDARPGDAFDALQQAIHDLSPWTGMRPFGSLYPP